MTSRRLLHGLLDDASLFPPASLTMPAAIAGHARHKAAWYRALCGPFVIADSRLTDLRTVLTTTGTSAIELALVVTGGAGVHEALDAVAADPRLRLRSIEVPAIVPASKEADPFTAITEVATALDEAPLAAATACIEYPLQAIADPAQAGPLLAIAGDRGYRVKLRTGGVSAEAFPDEATLAGCLAAIAERRVPFKCTAGLHHAVRHTAADTGFEHHGFLNVLLATWAAAEGASARDVTELLAERDPAAVAARVSLLDEYAADDVRGLFTSFGTCSVQDPVGDLVTLGLLSQPDSAKMQ